MTFIRKKAPSNSYLNTNPKNKRLKSQIAIIITLVIAALFLLTIVYINIFKVSNIKDITSRAVDKNALGLASKLGSISHKLYIDLLNLGAGDPLAGEICVTDWWQLTKYIVYGAFFLAAFLLIPSPAILLTGLGFMASIIMTSSISQSFQQMTDYNRLREETLFSALSAVQSDDVQLRVLPGLPGHFQEYDAVTKTFVGPDYDLTTLPAMLTARTVSRFEAWYYTQRLPLVSDAALKDSLNAFLNNTTAVGPIGILRWILPEGWNAITGKYATVSLLIDDHTVTPAYEITCNPCTYATWVLDTGSPWRIRMEMIDNAPYTDITWGPPIGRGPDPGIGGYTVLENDSFLTTQFYSLLFRLKTDYGADAVVGPDLDFVDNNGRSAELDLIIKDLQHFLSKTKDLLEMPVNLRLSTITAWFPSFYDINKHCYNYATNTGCRSSISSNVCTTPTCTTPPPPPAPPCNCSDADTCADPNLDTNNSYDIYLRLVRDQCHLNSIIAKLTHLDTNKIIPSIQANHDGPAGPSFCTQGDRNLPSLPACATAIRACACYYFTESGSKICTGNACEGWQNYMFWGNYGSCTGTTDHSAHPVCNFPGDLYFSTPGWCNDLVNVTCTSNADSCDTCTFDMTQNPLVPPFPLEFAYQGQLSWRNPTPGQFDGSNKRTEVGQAIDILHTLVQRLMAINMAIGTMADKIAALPGPQASIRNEAVYAWKDRRHQNGLPPQYAHFVRVRLIDYPQQLPYVSTSENFGGARKCYELHNYKGDFSLLAARYDQDQPTQYWIFRRRAAPSTSEIVTGTLSALVDDIQGRYGTTVAPGYPNYFTAGGLGNSIFAQSIWSRAKAHFGPTKPDIALTQTEGDVVGPPEGGFGGGGGY